MAAEQERPVANAVDASAEVWEPNEPALRQVYAAIPAAIGVPGVHLAWRRLAAFPAFLTAAWPQLAAALASPGLRSQAETLVSASFLADAVGQPSHKAFRGDLARAEIDAELRERIERFNDMSQISVARLLVLSAAMQSGIHSLSPAAAPAAQEEVFTPSEVVGVYVPPLRRGEATGKAQEVLARIESEHHLPWLDDYYRSLARIPDYLSAAWNAIRPVVGDPVYLELAASIREQAASGEGGRPAAAAARRALDLCHAGEQQTIALLLDAFATPVLPQTLIDITLIKALTSGPDYATALGPKKST